VKPLTPAEPPADPLTADLDRGLSLPASWFTDPAVVDREQERIFRRAWQYAGRTDQVAQTGDYVTGVAGDVPIVVVRGDGGLKAFVNVCRHRRHLVMSGAGNRKALQCPYHAWTYGLDGCLRAAPRSDGEEGFRKEDYPLLPARVETWGPFVFVSLDLQARPLTAYLGGLPQIIAQSGLALDRLKFHSREEWEARANWKVMIENFLECYHCPVQHPGFSAVIDVHPDSYTLTAHEWFLCQTAPVRRSALEGDGKTLAYDPAGAVTQAQYHFLWPNFTLSINPGHPNLSLDVWIPDGPHRTRGFTEHYFGPDVPEAWAEQLIAFNKQVGEEDDRLTDSVQRGLRAGVPAQGRFLVRSEHLALHFERLVLAALAAPDAGKEDPCG
jgi:phenylpropionate dioxygenase-like ring-hydroxylating dioxygenase large terminal subunit